MKLIHTRSPCETASAESWQGLSAVQEDGLHHAAWHSGGKSVTQAQKDKILKVGCGGSEAALQRTSGRMEMSEEGGSKALGGLLPLPAPAPPPSSELLRVRLSSNNGNPINGLFCTSSH